MLFGKLTGNFDKFLDNTNHNFIKLLQINIHRIKEF